MPRRKKRDAADEHEYRRLIREQQSDLVSDEFPGVERIEVHLTFEDFDETAHPETKSLTFLPASNAFFEIKCPFQECVMGGFDFAVHVREAVRKQDASVTGRVKCQGWQDRERLGRHGCYLKAHYDIRIGYAEAAVAET